MTALAQQTAPLWSPTDPLWQKAAPESYRVRMETTKGIRFGSYASLAPRGADRFYHLVESGFYDDSRFFRAVPGRFIQFGIAGNPKLRRPGARLSSPTKGECQQCARLVRLRMTAPERE